MRNFAALKDDIHGNHQCEDAGCCFSEEAFLKGEDACYRAEDYGTCERIPKGFKKRECGYDGITENECLVNPKCCYNPTADIGEPWCHFKMSGSMDGKEGWCERWSEKKFRHVERPACFVTDKDNLFTDDEASNINNLVSQETCEKAGCCFDPSLDVSEIDFLKDGLGLNQGPTRCFKKVNPFITQTVNGDLYGTEEQKDANGKWEMHWNLADTDDIAEWDVDKEYGFRPVDGFEIPNEWATEAPRGEEYEFRKVFTCDVSNWADDFVFKRSCGENLSYYQCVYVNKCCYRPNFLNQPACYKPEVQRGDGGP
jgi:hypothetical protein